MPCACTFAPCEHDVKDFLKERDAAVREVAKLRAEVTTLCAERDGAVSIGTQLEREVARLRKALCDLSTWHRDCHEHDEDMGHELRDADVEMVDAMQAHARATLREVGDK